MCLIVVGWQVRPDLPLVVAANRDEYLARPASPAHWWTDVPTVLAGRDLEAGGTWMGLSRNGRFAALTNFRDPTVRRPGAPSRGALVRECLTATEGVVPTLERIAEVSAGYPGFNLLLSDGSELGIHESTTGAVRRLEPGIYGLSNHLLDTPWPKVRAARERFTDALDNLPDEQTFLDLLQDRSPAPESELPNTGISAEWERWLSSAFIRAPGYGTRCSTLIRAMADGFVRLREWTWDKGGGLESEVIHLFRPTSIGAMNPESAPPRQDS